MDKKLREFLKEKSLLEIDSDGTPTSRSLQLAVVALLWEMAYADAELLPEEFTEVVRAANREFKVMDNEAGELIQTVDYLRRHSQQLNFFFEELNSHFDQGQRQHIFKLIWKIAESDGYVDKREQELAEFIRAKLNIPADAIH